MRIKGTALRTTQQFVQEKFPNKYKEWLNILPEKSFLFYDNVILVAEWYPLIEGVIIPTQKIAELFYNNDYKKAAYEVGYYSAVSAVNSVYKIFIKIASIDYALRRATNIFSTYYDGGEFQIIESTKDHVKFRVDGFDESEKEIFDRIAGWIHGIFELISRQRFSIEYITHPASQGKLTCIILAKWI